MPRLSTRDKEKPLILVAAVVLGVILQRLIGHEIPGLIYATEIGVFLVILAVMTPVEIRDVGRAFTKVRPTAAVLLVNFVLIPAFSWLMVNIILKGHPDFQAGAILYTLTPCIGWYLIFTDIAQGDVPWGVALLPWNITLQVVLMPVYLYLLVGRIIPVDLATLARSVALFLVAPFILGYGLQRLVINNRGRQYFFGPFKAVLGEVKLWALVAVIVSMFVSQRSIGMQDVRQLSLLIGFLVAFFVVLLAVALAAGKGLGLGYADTVTMAFSTTARNSEAVIGVAVAAFPNRPLVYLAIILGPIVELPMLLLFSRVLLGLRPRLETAQERLTHGVAATESEKAG